MSECDLTTDGMMEPMEVEPNGAIALVDGPGDVRHSEAFVHPSVVHPPLQPQPQVNV